MVAGCVASRRRVPSTDPQRNLVLNAPRWQPGHVARHSPLRLRLRKNTELRCQLRPFLAISRAVSQCLAIFKEIAKLLCVIVLELLARSQKTVRQARGHKFESCIAHYNSFDCNILWIVQLETIAGNNCGNNPGGVSGEKWLRFGLPPDAVQLVREPGDRQDPRISSSSSFTSGSIISRLPAKPLDQEQAAPSCIPRSDHEPTLDSPLVRIGTSPAMFRPRPPLSDLKKFDRFFERLAKEPL